MEEKVFSGRYSRGYHQSQSDSSSGDHEWLDQISSRQSIQLLLMISRNWNAGQTYAAAARLANNNGKPESFELPGCTVDHLLSRSNIWFIFQHHVNHRISSTTIHSWTTVSFPNLQPHMATLPLYIHRCVHYGPWNCSILLTCSVYYVAVSPHCGRKYISGGWGEPTNGALSL